MLLGDLHALCCHLAGAFVHRGDGRIGRLIRLGPLGARDGIILLQGIIIYYALKEIFIIFIMTRARMASL